MATSSEPLLLLLLQVLLVPSTSKMSCDAASAAAATTTAPATTTAEPLQTSTRRTKPLWNQTQTDRLKHDLLLGYDKFARPHAHDTRTEVDLLVVLKHINVDEFAGIMSIDAWVKMFWTDPKLTWNPTQYGNLSTLYVADHEIWQPDIMLYNSATSPGMSASHYETSQLVVSSDGGIIWVPMTRLEVYCDLDLSNWPFDMHTCEFRMGSWVYDKTHMDIVVHNETFTFDPHIEGEPWEVRHTEFERKETLYACCPELYVDVSFKITAQRRGAAYHSVITAPLSASVMLLLISFWIPFQRAEKLMLHAVNVLILVFTLMYLTHIVPILTNRTPHVVQFYACTLFLVCLAAGLTVGLMNMTRLKRPWPVPWPFRVVVTAGAFRWIMAGAIVEEVLETSRTGGDQPDSVAILPLPTPRGEDAGVEAMHMEDSLELTFARNRREWNSLAVCVERTMGLLCFIIIFCFSVNSV